MAILITLHVLIVAELIFILKNFQTFNNDMFISHICDRYRCFCRQGNSTTFRIPQSKILLKARIFSLFTVLGFWIFIFINVNKHCRPESVIFVCVSETPHPGASSPFLTSSGIWAVRLSGHLASVYITVWGILETLSPSRLQFLEPDVFTGHCGALNITDIR